VTGEAIANDIEKAIKACNLNHASLRGQAYDGASNMSGRYKGCAANIQKSTLRQSTHIVALMHCSATSFAVINKVYKYLTTIRSGSITLLDFVKILP